ncbi:ribosome hibernation-promoting factor, HPF/YfiA family [Bradyrhizobium sp. LHD-71]|uniref:ribosome hibernation-promoting factor, HPF/YfiA family n=1 Tax=Bradyrhizobium sp. LHD-71 TaxID=3072141 RepID=UPI00280C584D|nr:ribosome-associated translation inhibitor RaiA [Bradyrhizobium sp. LHD-71]MDQ8731893.1 ribosome-associated translation inhibitor RaiA [Bradyrhizobium sp. LHD-71]
MTIRVSGKGISVSEALRERVSGRTDDVLRKYFDGNFSGHVTIGKGKNGFRTDCMLHLDSGMILEADSTAGDAYASADLALGQIEKRLRRYKSRLKDRSARKAYAAAASDALAAFNVPSYVIEAPPLSDDEEMQAFNPVIIAETTQSLRRLSVSEAVMELDLTGAPVVVFLHGTSGRVNLIYRRPDGNIGWVDPPAVNS